MKTKKITWGFLGLMLGLATDLLALVIWPLLCATFFYGECDDEETE